jgi:hypothetical protein
MRNAMGYFCGGEGMTLLSILEGARVDDDVVHYLDF